MVVFVEFDVTKPDDLFDKFLVQSFCQELSPAEFFEALNERMTKVKTNPSILPHICKFIVKRGSKILYKSIRLALDYVNYFFVAKSINETAYVSCLTSFDAFHRVDDVSLIVQNLCDFASKTSCCYTSEEECILMCQLIFSVLQWMVDVLGNCLESVEIKETEIAAINSILKGILFLTQNSFSSLMIFVYFDFILGRFIPDKMPKLVKSIQKSSEILSSKFSILFTTGKSNPLAMECAENMKKLLTIIPKLSNVPTLEWDYFREDFIYRECRPAILTLGSTFATFRVLKSNEEIAESFLVVGETLGISRTQIVYDILRSGFLVQLETTAGQPEHRDREAMADMFVFLRIPIILSKMIKLRVLRSEVYEALLKISKCSTLLNELDSKKLHNTFRHILQELIQMNVLTNEQFNALEANRRLGIEQKPALMELLCKEGDDLSSRSGFQQSRVHLIVVAQKAKKAFERTINQDSKKWVGMVPMIQRLMQSGEINVDLICSVCCADGDLSAFSSKLASINFQTQRVSSVDPETIKSRVFMFDSTFILLSRIAMVWEDLRLEDLVGENTDGAFYCWIKKYTYCLDNYQKMEVDERLKMNFFNQINLLKNSTPFWNETWDFATLIDHVPLIGDIILDEYKKEHYNEMEIHNILSTFRQMTCLLLCLVQWLETQPPDPARQAFAKTLRNFGNTRGQEPGDRWLYTMLVARKSSKQMAECRRQKEQPYTWVINFAQRQLPNVSQFQNEGPDLQMLKEAFLYSNQQSWANPDVIALINRCNKAVNQGKWCKCWMMQMLKSWTSDEMEVASELCLSAALTYPVPCLLEITQQLVDYVLFNVTGQTRAFTSTNLGTTTDNFSFSTNSSSFNFHQSNYVNISINKTSSTVLAKMLVRTLILLIWAEDRRKLDRKVRNQQKNLRKRKLTDESETAPMSAESIEAVPDNTSKNIKLENLDDDQSTTQKDSNSLTVSSESADPVLETIVRVFERFENMIKGGCLRPPVTFIIFFIHELAKAPKTLFRQKLIDLIPINLIFTLAHLDRAALPLSMFLILYDIKDEKHRLHCLKYACMMRSFGMI